jgi:outer membrane biosynthesis protein TonB
VTTTSGGPVPVAAAARGRSRWPLYAAIALVLILLGALLIWSPWSNDDADTTGDDPAADTVRVRKAAYVGKPVDEVENALGDKGLETEVETIDNPGDEEAGTVADLSPFGKVAEGELITLEVWDDPPAPETEEPDDTEPDKTKEPKPKPEKTEAPKPEKTEKPDNGGTGEDPGQEGPTDKLTQGAGKPDKVTQSGTGKGD